MGNCANKPLTTEGDAPVPEPEMAAKFTAAEVVEREIVVDENKVITTDADADHQTKPRSLAQMLEEEGKKPETEETAKPTVEEKPSEPKKTEEVTKEVEIKKEETLKPAVNEPAKPEVAEPKKEEVKPAEVAPAAKKPDESTEKKVEEKKPEAK